MNTPGYEKLADVLQRAFDQAAKGKGLERHASGEPFHEQVMQVGARKFGVGSLLFQAFKKSEESQRLPLDRGVAELLGAINYLAGAVIAREAAEDDKRGVADLANDLRSMGFTTCSAVHDDTQGAATIHKSSAVGKTESMAMKAPAAERMGELVVGSAEGRVVQCDAEGWIKWPGGACPVPEGVRVDVRCVAGHVLFGKMGGHLRWNHSGAFGDIIAYRIVING